MGLWFSLNEIVFDSDMLQPRRPREAELKVRRLPVRYPTPVYVLAILWVKLEIINDASDQMAGEGARPTRGSMGQGAQFFFGKELQFHPTFDWKCVHWQAVLPDTEAQSKFCRDGTR